ncbi:YtpI family protein [Aquibacillus sp. 3ASR75-11]|uniref:YtpI family protein n=1 Tax=Terrihalobacillus insolitus TaxID=2950438 RepID=A0A9X3WVC1_9BACI|nr:YtpI family protein [Terrihalobacillus insolitus]MDC3412644.1 YtpI family protein [Terrihalobacillus insolitus]MDC3423994.1 YtpI family protein [Terrihalobacillus insolitus]
MVIFPIIIVISLVLYIYYKVAIIRTSEELNQHYYNAKARLFLGSFVLFFGINQYFFYETTLSLFIGIIFLIVGGLQMIAGFKRTRFYGNQLEKTS